MSESDQAEVAEAPPPEAKPKALGVLSAKDIQEVKDLKVELLDLPEWGGAVHVRELTGRTLFEFQMLLPAEGEQVNPDALGKVAAMVLSDEDGKALFPMSSAPILGEKKFSALLKILEKALEVQGLTDDEENEIEGESTGDQT